MKIAEIALHVVRVPLKREVKHASAAHRQSRNLLAGCKLAEGTEGWGEGVPRANVTGETVEGAVAQLAATPVAEQLSGDCGSWEDVIALLEGFQLARLKPDPRGCYGNALRCAVELGVLDAFGKLFGEPVREVIRHHPVGRDLYRAQASVRYSGVVTGGGPWSERIAALKMRLYGFAHCKVKVGMDPGREGPRLRRIRRWLGGKMDLRVDANGAWRAEELLQRIEELRPAGPSCIEQPVAHEEVEALAPLRERIGVPVMLDESLTGLIDAERAVEQGTCDVFNIRLSKCGGFLNSLILAAIARGAGLKYQLGCHPGETGVLSAAGRHWAAGVADVVYLEGSYDRHVLGELLTKEDLTFGYGGKAPALAGPGLGVTIDRAALKRASEDRKVYRIG